MKTLTISNLVSSASSASSCRTINPVPDLSLAASILPSCHSATLPLLPDLSSPSRGTHESSTCDAPSSVTNTLKPVTELLTEFQSRFAAESANLALDDPKLQLLILTYTQLNHLANIERINESLDRAGQGPKLLALLREMNKALSLQERVIARHSREQAAKDREVRRIRREQERAEREARRRLREEERKERDRLKAESMARCARIKLETEEVRLQCARIKAEQKEQAARERAQRKEEKAAKAAAKHTSRANTPIGQSA